MTSARTLTCWSTAVLLVVAPAPAAADPGDDPQRMNESSERFAAARRHLDAGDHDAAIDALQSGLDAIPSGTGYGPTRARMLLMIVDAHEAGFASDNDLDNSSFNSPSILTMVSIT